MFYCKKCRLICTDNECQSCGSNELENPQDNDSVHLISKDAIWSGMVEEILNKNGIPYLKQGLLGAGITSKIGYAKERYQFFVPFGAYNKAMEFMASVFVDETDDS